MAMNEGTMKSLKTTVATVPAVCAILLAGCGQSPQHTPEAAGPATNTSTNVPAPTAATDVQGGPKTKLEFSAAGSSNRITTKTPAEWTLQVKDAVTGQPINSFEKVHERMMHLIVVSKDLSYFNHLHPNYNGKGIFTVKTSLPDAGPYKLFADLKPSGGEQEVPQYELTAEPAPGKPAANNIVLAEAASLVIDKPKDGWLVKRVFAHAEGDPTSSKTVYEVALMLMPSKLVVGQEAMLHFQIRDASGKPVNDLQPYLGGMGHCVIISSDTSAYLHTHPQGGAHEGAGHSAHMPAPKSGGPDVMFQVTFQRDGLYKVWGEFQHKGKIITAPFVVEVGMPGSGATASSGDAGTAHESHAH
jgi:hypothetical protein